MEAWPLCFWNGHHGSCGAWSGAYQRLRSGSAQMFRAATGALFPLTLVGMSEWMVSRLGVDRLINEDALRVEGFI